jgi:hypothetical protein
MIRVPPLNGGTLSTLGLLPIWTTQKEKKENKKIPLGKRAGGGARSCRR